MNTTNGIAKRGGAAKWGIGIAAGLVMLGCVVVAAAYGQTAPATGTGEAPATTRAVMLGGTGMVVATRPASLAPRPTTAVANKSCVTKECHAEVKDYKVVHGPVNVDACDACHKVDDVSKHTFILARDKKEICTFCHKMETKDAAVVHKPVMQGDCLPCHNPHGGKTTKFIRVAGGGGMNDLCKQCHQDVIGKKTHIHGPVAAGACEACHQPHAAKYPKLLVAEGKALCLTCHKEMGEQMKTMKVTHKPVKEGECAQCHDPHASDYAMQVKAAPAQLCTSCHEHDAIKKMATDAKYKHTVVLDGQACMNCHTPHGGQLAKLMKAQPVELCLKCHAEKVKEPDIAGGAAGVGGRVVASVAEVRDPKLVKHGPVKDGMCSGCHNVHGSDNTRLLAKAYPETFYAPYGEDKYALCFSCHDVKLVKSPKVEGTEGGLTNFRNGDVNLHYLHVNKADKGRTCRACHETHASKEQVLVRESVPYGQWELPVNYKKTETGGSCAPGCHKEYAYDRKVPAVNAAAAPAGGAAATAPIGQ